ncbi:MAG: hypothetical protein ABFS30_02315 [Pseudomonadota bacterium]
MNSHSQIEADLSTPYFAAREAAAVPDGLDQRIHAARARSPYSDIRLVSAVDSINAAILAAVHRNVVDGRIVPGWPAFLLPTLMPVTLYFAWLGGEIGYGPPARECRRVLRPGDCRGSRLTAETGTG